MSGNDIGDSGMLVITEVLQSNKTLKRLNVSNCDLSAKGIVLYIDEYIAS